MQRRFIRMSELASTKEKPGRWPVSSGTIWRWVADGILPPPIQLGPQVRAWDLEVIETHEAKQAAAAPVDTAQKVAAAAASVKKRQAAAQVQNVPPSAPKRTKKKAAAAPIAEVA